MRAMTQKEKRRIRDAARKAADLDAKHQHDISLAKVEAKLAGKLEGLQEGAKTIKAHVLEHAGRLYKERKDSDAAAVREVHRLLPASI